MCGRSRVEGQAISPRRRLQETAPAPIRRLARLPGITIRALPISLATKGKKARATRQPLMVTKPPRLVGGRVAITPQLRSTFQGLSLGATALRSRCQRGRPRVRPSSPRPLFPRRAPTLPEHPAGLRKDTRSRDGLPLSGRVPHALAFMAAPQAAAIAAEVTATLSDRALAALLPPLDRPFVAPPSAAASARRRSACFSRAACVLFSPPGIPLSAL